MNRIFAHWHIGTIAHWHIGTIAHWHIGKLAHWQIGTLAHWHIGKLVHWHIGKLAHWHISKLAHWLLCFQLLISSNVYSQFVNIMIDNTDDCNEPSIVCDPENSDVLVAGANINKVYVSTDGGLTWKKDYLDSKFGVWGDPCIVVDTNSNFYYFHLSNYKNGHWIDRIVCQKLEPPYTKWSEGTGIGYNGSKDQDKEWACVDRANNNIYVAWTQFDDYGSSNPSDSSVILFSKSVDNGASWSDAIRISQFAGDCRDSDMTTEGAMPCVGINGEIFVVYSFDSKIFIDKSIDNGASWLAEDIVISNQHGGWDYTVPGIYRTNGMPVIASDLSKGPYRGTIYVNWTDQSKGPENTDVWVSKSIDGGLNWSEPLRVNDDNTSTHQFLSWMTIDQTTGYVYFVFYDRRNYTDSRTDVYLAYSTDGCKSFENIKISETPFNPNPYVFFGDYTNIVAHNGRVIPVWARMDDEINSIWTTIIDKITDSKTFFFNSANLISDIYTQSSGTTTVVLNINNPEKYSMFLFDIYGRQVESFFKDKFLGKGKNYYDFNNSKFSRGLYVVLIKTNKGIDRKKIFF